MDIDNAKEVTFSAVVYGTAQDLPTAQAAAEWFRQELEKRHIQYKLWQATAYPPP